MFYSFNPLIRRTGTKSNFKVILQVEQKNKDFNLKFLQNLGLISFRQRQLPVDLKKKRA